MTLDELLRDEMEETGEVNVALIVPHYLKRCLGRKVRPPLTDILNYDLADDELVSFVQQIKTVVQAQRWSLYRWGRSEDSEELGFNLIALEQANSIINDKLSWCQSDGLIGLFLLNDKGQFV